MNILYVFHSLQMGGAEKISVDTAVAMRGRGHSIYVVSSRGELEKVLLQNSINFIEISIIPERKTLVSFINIFFRIFYIILKYKIDIVHTIHRWPNFICFFVCVMSNTKLIWTDHVILKGKKFLTIYKDKIISVSYACKRHLIEYFHIPENKITVIRNAIRSSAEPKQCEIKEFLNEVGVGHKDKVVCTIARLTKQKGHEYLLRAIPKILSQVTDAYFLFAGDGDLKDSLVKLANNLGITKHVCFLGQRNDISVILATSEIMVLPSLWEGFPLTILEAFSLGKPVVATNAGGNAELVSDDETGYIVKPKNSEALANSIIKILSDKNKCKEMGLRARNLVLEKFNFDEMISKIEQVYKEVMER